ncbi:Probable GTP-binding protein OBGM- mitochondrial [Striga hermonthica]|uniref:Probable GTP-binding protein OBGM- mitochondrial n=1 Tax=Striga hermonthica TaxID=68872 RepID=A0A9N7MMX1_STRHE|nr:Probable GTP-binding protein OBGM- mitochondrial [Striga hermonthica]
MSEITLISKHTSSPPLTKIARLHSSLHYYTQTFKSPSVSPLLKIARRSPYPESSRRSSFSKSSAVHNLPPSLLLCPKSPKSKSSSPKKIVPRRCVCDSFSPFPVKELLVAGRRTVGRGHRLRLPPKISVILNQVNERRLSQIPLSIRQFPPSRSRKIFPVLLKSHLPTPTKFGNLESTHRRHLTQKSRRFVFTIEETRKEMMWARGRNTVTHLEAATKFSRFRWLFLSCSYSDISCKKTKAPLQERRMIDRFRLWAKGGDGGNGCTSFRRSRHVRRGKPDGGNGGRGGDVILECSPSVWDFRGLQHHVNAKRGGHGASKNMIGTRGPDKVVLVPVGTVIHLLEGVIPSSSVEKKPSGTLDPWEIPGSLYSNSSDNFQQSPTESISKRPKADNSHQNSSRLSRRTPKEPPFASRSQVSPRFSTYKPQTEPGPDWQPPEPHGYSVWEDTDNEANISETNFEEFSEETEQAQYDVSELIKPGERITVARGGDGGLGNMHFTKGSKADDDDNDLGHQSPDNNEARVEPNIGQPGSEAVLLLELKSIADVGLVGMPNAGKSTLLGAMSRAKPVIGHYAFTTLRPNLGKMNYDDLSITVADIPGLISGAHENRGLGHAFLRHIERTKVLAYVLDLSAGLDGRKGEPPWVQLRDLMMELEFYREGLSARPALVVANKIDEEGAERVYEELRERVRGAAIFPVCAVLEEGVPELREGLRRLVNGEEEASRIDLGSIVVD